MVDRSQSRSFQIWMKNRTGPDFQALGATSGCVLGMQRHLGDPKVSVLNSNEGHTQ